MAKKGTRTGRPAKPYQVFISHATDDKWIARMLCEKVETVGAITFRDDRDINGGEEIPDEIRRQIRRSREIIVLLTPESVGRTWVTWEMGAAWGWSKTVRIVPVLCHVSTAPIPDMIKSLSHKGPVMRRMEV